MGRRVSSRPKHASRDPPIDDTIDDTIDFDDDVDTFHRNRDRIRLTPATTNNDGSESDVDEEVLGLNISDDDDARDVINKMPGLRRHLKDTEIDMVEDEDDVNVDAWGRQKSMYYDDDAEEDEEAAKEEEEEAMRLQKERKMKMEEADFMDDFDDAFSRRVQHDKAGSGDTANDDLKHAVDQVNQELEEMDQEVIEKDLSHLSTEELIQHVTAESPELLDLLTEFKEKINQLTNQVQPLLEKVRSGNFPTSQGITLLELKNQLLLSYCTNLAFYFYLKADGKRVQDHPVIEKLVELRLYLEKIKPIEQKLRYQIDKLVNTATNAEMNGPSTTASSDPLKFQPNPDAFEGVDGEEEEASDDETSGLYKAPRIAPVHFDETPMDKKRKNESERAKKLATSSRFMRDLMEEVGEVPEEIHDAGNMLTDAMAKDEEWERKVMAEELIMSRLPMTRRDKRAMKKQERFADELALLDDFGDMPKFDGDSDLEVLTKSKKRSKKEKNAHDNDDDEDMVANKKQKTFKKQDDADVFSSDDGAMEYYEQAKQASKEKKAQKQQQFESRFESAFDDDVSSELLGPEDKRTVNYQIMKNKGLTPVRKKEQRNPRVKHRKKYEKSMIKLKSFKSVVKSQNPNYAGEETGIKKNLARSVKF